MKALLSALACIALVYGGCVWIVALEDDGFYPGERERNPYWYTVSGPTLAPRYRQYANARALNSNSATVARCGARPAADPDFVPPDSLGIPHPRGSTLQAERK